MAEPRKSSLVPCPICERLTPEWYINDHIDNNCSGPPQETPKHKRASPPTGLSTSISMDSPTPTKRLKKTVDNAEHVIPLAERVRPTAVGGFMGQQDLMGYGGPLRMMIEKDRIVSMILWGPPGSGKTTVARIIAAKTSSRFISLSATTTNTNEIRNTFEEARSYLQLTNRRTIVFLDEIHRINRAQQDLFLPAVERGTIVLIGATTENPSFKIIGALLSRCRVFVLQKLKEQEVFRILSRALRVWRSLEEEESRIDIGEQENENEDDDERENDESNVLRRLARISDGDARNALNILDIALSTLSSTTSTLTHENIRSAFQKSHILYDHAEEHYNAISALHKSIRGSDADAALYWLARMLAGGEDPLYIARRLIRCASEDIGIADNSALTLAVSTYQTCQFLGIPECDCTLAQCVVYLAEAPKSVRVYKGLGHAKEAVIEEYTYPIPLHLRNAPTRLMKDLGYGAGYKYNPDYVGPVEQEYLPHELKRRKFLDVPE